MSIITVGTAKEEHHQVLAKAAPGALIAPPPPPPAEVTSGWRFYRKPAFKISLAGIFLALGFTAEPGKKKK